jgi:hypothetical protein
MFQDNWANSILDFAQKDQAIQALCSLDIHGTPGDPNPLHIVVSNEYCFRMSPAAAIKKLKQTYHGQSTLPNTPARTSPETFAHFQGPKVKNTMCSATDKDFLLHHLCAATQGHNVLVIPGTVFWTEREPAMRTTGAIIKSQVVASKGVVRNSLFVIYRGNLIKTYHKRTESHELDSFEQDKFDFREGINDSLFEANGLTFGADICADLTSSRNVRTGLITKANPQMDSDAVWNHNKLTAVGEGGQPRDIGVDVHLVLSDGMPSDGMPYDPKYQAVRKGGCGVHCDSRINPSVQTKDPTTGKLTSVPEFSPRRWKVNLVSSAQGSQSFAANRAFLESNLKLRRPT